MKRNLLVLALFVLTLFTVGINCLAESSVVTDLRELSRLRQYDPLVPFPERKQQRDAIKARVEPIVQKELAKLVDGVLTPLVYDLLAKPETLDFCYGILCVQILTYPTDVQAKVLETVFDATSDSQRVHLILSFLEDLPKEAFAGKKIQQWLVDKINGGGPGGAFYFILTEDNARTVEKTATESMRRFSKTSKRKDDQMFSAMSIVFLASRGDEGAVKLLDSLLEQRDINSEFDSGIILVAAMSGNEKLIKKILGIVTTDKRTRFIGDDCMPPEVSFAHEAAVACALTIDGFPPVKRWFKYDDGVKENVRLWIEANPAYTLKAYTPRVFLKEHFNNIIPAMRRVMEKE